MTVSGSGTTDRTEDMLVLVLVLVLALVCKQERQVATGQGIIKDVNEFGK